MIELNSALDFTFFDESGRLLKLRCGHVDVAHPNGWFAIYINNAMVYITDKEPEYRVTMVTNFAVVQNWAEQVFKILFDQWQRESPKPDGSAAFPEWRAELIRVIARATGQSERVIKINDTEAEKWYRDGFTPYQCFRETYDMENDAG